MLRTASLVLFDLDDTLCDYTAARALRLRTAFGQALAAVRELAADELDRLIAESIAIHPHGADHFPELLARYGLEDPAARAAQRWYTENRFHGLALLPDTLTVLERLRGSGRRIGLVTNGPADVQRDKIALLGLWPHIDFAVISGEVGVEKPDPAIFLEALRRGSASPAEAVYIGDSPEFDVAGAHAAGIRVVWMNRQRAPWGSAERPPHHAVATLSDVLIDVEDEHAAREPTARDTDETAEETR
jgi:putative hydrolase of the HAD superfamily